MSTAVSPWVLARMAADPAANYGDVIPKCETCGFTFHSHYCVPSQDGEGSRCHSCAGVSEDPYPCCWGGNHEYAPIPVARSSFTESNSSLFCNACYGAVRASAHGTGQEQGQQQPPLTLPAHPTSSGVAYPQCKNQRDQRFYNSLLPLQGAAVRARSPWHARRLRECLDLWLNYLFSEKTFHPLRCLNCYGEAACTDANPFCVACRSRGIPSAWHGFQACGRCHLFRPMRDFVGALGSYVTTCDHCRGKQRNSGR